MSTSALLNSLSLLMQKGVFIDLHLLSGDMKAMVLIAEVQNDCLMVKYPEDLGGDVRIIPIASIAQVFVPDPAVERALRDLGYPY